MANENEDFEEDFLPEESTRTAEPQNYTMRNILLWERDESRRNMGFEFLSDLLHGATIRTVASEEEALEALSDDECDWDTFVVDLTAEGVSASEFVKRANNYPAAILVALSFAFLELEERDSAKQEQIRRLFDVEKPTPTLRA